MDATPTLRVIATNPVSPPNSEDRIALEFSKRHADDLRHVGAWGKWFHWSGTHWQDEQTYLAFDLARRVCREFASSANDHKPGTGKSIAAAKTVAAVVNLARADRRHALSVDAWDCDPWLLNTPVGTIDLRTGETQPHLPSDHITKTTGVSADHDMQTPIWDTFINRVTSGDDELVSFLQRIAGYALTGDTREHALFFLYGLGANGKSTFLNALIGVLGDYAVSSPIETFTEQKGQRHLTELARLRGARLVTSTETEEGRRWAESRIKALTGGDKIAANFMRQDLFEYTPQFKLIVAGNHKPGLRSVDEAIRRRFNLIPFTANIPAEERDTDLGDKLKAEWPGILAWAISGCIEWQEGGLRPPQVVNVATDDYLSNEDIIATWIEECCEVSPNASERGPALYASWKKWAEDSGEFVLKYKDFREKLENRGFQTKRSKSERLIEGLRTRQEWAG